MSPSAALALLLTLWLKGIARSAATCSISEDGCAVGAVGEDEAALLQFGDALGRRRQLAKATTRPEYLPIFIMHGIFDSGSDVQDLCVAIQEVHAGTLCIPITVDEGSLGSTTVDMMTQVETVRQFILKEIQKQPLLYEHGFNLIGHSQGGILCRGLISKWSDWQYPIKTFVSLAGPQQGVDSFSDVMLPPFLRSAASGVFYDRLSQSAFSGAGYWKDMTLYDEYQRSSRYLAIINNEAPEEQCTYHLSGCQPSGCQLRSAFQGCTWPAGIASYNKNPAMQENFKALEHAVFAGSPADGVIKPWQSAVWGYYAEGSGTLAETHTVLPFAETPLGKHDLVPLKMMNSSGKLHFCTPDNVTHNDWKVRRSGEFEIGQAQREYVLSCFIDFLV